MTTASPNDSSVSVVVVNWNGGERVLACLESLDNQSRRPNEIILVDNASDDGSVDAIPHRFTQILVIRNPSNLGYGAGVNRGVAAATSAWIALLNNDAVADRDWIAQLLAVATSAPDYGMVASKIYLDRAQRVIDKVGHRIAIDGQNFGRGHGFVDDGRYDLLTEVAWPDGCAGLWRRSVFRQVGGLDEEFFAYADDADLGIRFRVSGWRCGLARHAIVEHRHSQSLGAYSAEKLYLVERNRIWLAAKYFPWPLLALNPLLWAWRALLTLMAHRQGKGLWAHVAQVDRRAVLRAILRAQLDGWLGVPRQLRKRSAMSTSCGEGWQQRFRSLLRDDRVALGDLARADVS